MEHTSSFEKILQERNEQISFFSRKEELSWLEDSFDTASVLGKHWGIKGGRRTGKTALVNYFIYKQKKRLLKNNEVVFSLVLMGNKHENVKYAVLQALSALILSCESVSFDHQIDIKSFENKILKNSISPWLDFFHQLKLTLLALAKAIPNVRVVLFFDEIDWFADNSHFLNGYSNLINQNIEGTMFFMTFIASSSNSWMKSRIFQDTKGFHRRLQKIDLQPFSFKEIVDFFNYNQWRLEAYEIFEYYQLFGGFIKHYLELKGKIDFSKSLEENWNNLNKAKDYIQSECLDIFRNIFDDKKQHYQYCEVICLKKHFSALDLKKYFWREKNGEINYDKSDKTTHQSLILNELVDAGILDYTKYQNQRFYFCNNPLLFFYFNFLKKNEIKDELSFQVEFERFQHWRGGSFELQMLKHIEAIGHSLSFTPSFVRANFKIEKEGKIVAQLDLLCRDKQNNSKKNTYYLLEGNCKQAGDISTQEIKDLIEREYKTFDFLQKQFIGKKVELKTAIIALTSDKNKLKFSLPEILLK